MHWLARARAREHDRERFVCACFDERPTLYTRMKRIATRRSRIVSRPVFSPGPAFVTLQSQKPACDSKVTNQPASRPQLPRSARARNLVQTSRTMYSIVRRAWMR